MRRIILATFFMLQLLGCLSYSLEAQHENFKRQFRNDVGKKSSNSNTNISRYPQLIIDSRKLSGGNIEKKLRWHGSCRVFYEIDPETKIILNWRFEGSKKDCTIAP